MGGAHAIFKGSPIERLFRDGATATIMQPSSDVCLSIPVVGGRARGKLSCEFAAKGLNAQVVSGQRKVHGRKPLEQMRPTLFPHIA